MLIHRIWLGGEMPQKYKEYGEEWKRLNPSAELWDWNELDFNSLHNWHNQDVLDDMIDKSKRPSADMIAFYTHVADVLDYELLYEYGGLYVNTDVKPLRSLGILNINRDVPALAYEDDTNLVNMAMYSPPKNPLFGKIIELLPKRYFGMPGQGMHITTGCGLIQQAISEYTGELVRWHRDVWNPIHWSTIEGGTSPDLNRKYPDCTVAVHEWNHKETGRGAEIL